MTRPFILEIVEPLAAKHGIALNPDPRAEHICMVYPDGRVRRLCRHVFDLNLAAAADMARVKAWSLSFLRAAGFPVPEFDFFFENAWAERHGTSKNEDSALAYAEGLGYPLVLKPSCLSLGQGVHMVSSAAALRDAIPRVTRLDPMFLIQRLAHGQEYRVVVFDGQIRLTYRKSPLDVAGDGSRTLRELLEERVGRLDAARGHLELDPGDPRIDSYLDAVGLCRESVPAAGEVIQVGLTANYNSGGTLRDAVDELPQDVAAAAIDMTRCAGLRLAGLDIMVEPPGRGPSRYQLIEVNAAPMFEGYARLGPVQRERVHELVESIMLAMGRD